MKASQKVLLTIALTLTSIVNTFAFESSISKYPFFEPGFQIGGDIIWLKYKNPMPEWQIRPSFGYSASTLLDLNFSRAFSVETGLHFSKIGDNRKFAINLETSDVAVPMKDSSYDSSKPVTGHVEEDIYSLSIPLKIILNNGYPFNIFAGIDLGYILKATGSVTFDDVNFVNSSKNNTSALNRINTALVFGVGHKFIVLQKAFSVRLESCWGLTNLAKKDQWYSDFVSRDISFSCLMFL